MTGSGFRALSDPEGRFEIATPEATQYLLLAADGFSRECACASPGRPVTVRLLPAYPVTGRILGATSSLPLVWAPVKEERGRRRACGSLVTAADGSFEASLPAGRYVFEGPPVRAGGRVVRVDPVEVAVPGRAVELLVRETDRVAGRVLDADGRPVAGSEVWARLLSGSRGGPELLTATTDPGGRFDLLGADPGTAWDLSVGGYPLSSTYAKM